ncbi:MAG TPA: hypothetical protein VII32_13370 [Thermoanaerobaculia bacterium]
MRAGWVVLVASAALAQPWSSGGPYGGAITAASASSRVVYAATSVGIYRSDDGGATFRNVSQTIRDATVIAADPRTPAIAYAVTASRLYKTVDGGVTWNDINAAIAPGILPTSVAIDPQNPDTVVVGSDCFPMGFVSAKQERPQIEDPGGIYESRDGGRTWRKMSNGIGNVASCIAELSLDPASPSHLFAVSTYGYQWKTFDGGGSWQMEVSPLPVTKIVAHPQLALIRYGIGSGRRGMPPPAILVSRDGGFSWTRTAGLGLPTIERAGIPYYDLTIDPSTARLFLATGEGVFRSGDGGENWIAVGAPGFPASAVMFDVPDSRLILATARGIDFAPAPGGLTWTTAELTGLRANVTSMAADPRNPSIVYASTSDWVRCCDDTHGRFFRSGDAGASWQLLPEDDAHARGAIAVDAAGDIYAAGPRGFSKLPAGSDRWIDVFASAPFPSWSITADPHLPGVVFASNPAAGTLRTRDDGKTWKPLQQPVTQVVIDPTNSNRVYGASLEFMRSIDGGETWVFSPPIPIPAPPDPPPLGTWSIALAASKPNVIYRLARFQGISSELFRSEDFGVTWTRFSHPAENDLRAQVLVNPRDERDVFIVSPTRGALRSTDGGATWKSINAGLPSTAINTAIVDSAGLFFRVALQNGGVWQMPLPPRGRAVRLH